MFGLYVLILCRWVNKLVKFHTNIVLYSSMEKGWKITLSENRSDRKCLKTQQFKLTLPHSACAILKKCKNILADIQLFKKNKIWYKNISKSCIFWNVFITQKRNRYRLARSYIYIGELCLTFKHILNNICAQ